MRQLVCTRTVVYYLNDEKRRKLMVNVTGMVGFTVLAIGLALWNIPICLTVVGALLLFGAIIGARL